MGACTPSRQYSKITPYKMDQVVQRIRAMAVSFSGNNPWDATIEKSGATIQLHGTWNAASRVLTVDVPQASWFAPCSTVWSQIEDEIAKVYAMQEPALAPPVVAAPPPVVAAPPPPVDVQPPPAPTPLVVTPPAAPVEYGSVAMQVEPAPAPVLTSRVDAMPGAPAASAAGALTAGGPNMMLVLGGGVLVAGAFLWLRSREKSAG
jgi:hypothetical protein